MMSHTVLLSLAAATPNPSPSAVAATANEATGTNWWVSILSAAVVAALITAAVNLWLARIRRLEDERARVRTTLAEAFQAYAEYKEFPYAIRRRNQDEPGKERVRLSETLRLVQARISYFEAWTRAESPTVGATYEALVAQARAVAGGAMRDAWLSSPITSDSGMNIPADVVDLSSLRPLETAYVEAAHEHLRRLTRIWPRISRDAE